jgi:glycosyltransferase involved in cell wall biosynthesis
MKIAMITAGGAGMFCGSCMQDNTLARALRMAGADAMLLPTYTPIRVDEEDVSGSRIFLGGLNVYLDSKIPGWRLLPRKMKRWMDRPGLVKLLSRLSSSTNASDLGPLTIDLLKGALGPQRTEIEELIRYLCDELRPDVILFSNALLSGVVPELRRQFSGQLCCLLQGDDIFLNGLSEPWRTRAISLVSQNAVHFDAFLTHSQFYADFMQQYLALPAERFRTIPLAIEDLPVSSITPRTANSDARLTVGYFARICPEKGAFRFLDAAEQVLPRNPETQMVMGGYLPEQFRRQFELRLKEIQSIAPDRLRWAGSPASRDEKFRLIQSFDWLCVPSEYREPKGLYVLEAALVGVPSLLPAHGAFPERLAVLGSGLLYNPESPDSLETLLSQLPSRMAEEGRHLRDSCLSNFGMEQTGRQVLEILGRL